jgi:hypothetical protein
MRIAVILTGALRTIRKTIRYFKSNIIEPNQQHTVDVFACVQNDNHHLESDWELWFKDQLGSHMKSIKWFTLTPAWTAQRDILLQHMPIDESWKGYLRRSGSMIEYAQLQQASMQLTDYEHAQRITYDYVIRTRTDSIYCKPVDFHWLQWTEAEVAQRVERIQQKLEESAINLSKTIPYFMSTLLSDDTIPNIKQIHAASHLGLSQTEPDVTTLHNYITEGRYILTLRANNLYIVKRNLFSILPALGTMYGQFKAPHSDAWWFNAEGQFKSICYYAGITTYDYNTVFEDKSVEANGWNESMFFDKDFNCIKDTMLFCVVRR